MSEFDAETFNPTQRRLCPDGSCVGVLDDDGRCRTCGVLAPAGAATTGFTQELVAWQTGPDGPDSGHHTGEHDEDVGSGFDPERRLCPDGGCVGILDAAGKCKVCGRGAAESSAAG